MIVFTISYMAAQFPTQKAIRWFCTKCSHAIPSLQSRICGPSISRLIGPPLCLFLPLQCSLPGLTAISQDFPARSPWEFPTACLWCQMHGLLPWAIGSRRWSTPATGFLEELEESFAGTAHFHASRLPTALTDGLDIWRLRLGHTLWHNL